MKGFLSAFCLAAAFGIAPASSAGADESGPELRLTVRGSFDVPAARAGDTVRYRVRVEWEDVPAAVMLMPLARLETPGFESAGGSTVHRKTLSGGKSLNVTEYTYELVAPRPGAARVAPFALHYRNGLTGRDEAVNVPGAVLEITPPRAPLARRPAVWIVAALALAGAAGWAIRKAVRSRRSIPRDPAPAESPFAAEIQALRRRCESADTRAWAADAERLCTRFLCERLGIPRPENVRFEAVLDQYLSRGRDVGPETGAAWNALRDLFHEARYAGLRREPHALLEACRHLKTCLNPTEGIEHGQPVSA